MLEILQDLQRQHLATVQDAAVVTWPADRKKPQTRQAASMAGLSALAAPSGGCCLLEVTATNHSKAEEEKVKAIFSHERAAASA